MEPSQGTVDALMKLDLPAGVDVEIKLSELSENAGVRPNGGTKK